MTDDTRKDLTDGWPDEPGNEELARFAAMLRSSRPAMAPEAMARVERAMKRGLSARRARGGRRWSVYPAYVLSAAAAAVLAVGVYLQFRVASPGPPPADTARKAPAVVHDRYRVRFAPLPAAAPDRALLDLDNYRSLYADPR